ncbi:uncharacterized protein H6S33_003308 [Morchella sextelata]|uniref:uncharacterized protein n=1 Tax=Morchella sextelata TaxID=1174677 RepID=UPI001D0594F3|nr:uncharacterized protein H6S33_003308 [Morchella sextelata]KAH0607320.1 hypothetical protein H6S33_003308 [Morchella sextelata]
MMPYVSVRCLNCNNIDEFPRMDYDEIPYCSQCASTTNLVPTTPPTKPQPGQQQWSDPTSDDLANLFSRNLSLIDPPATPPTSPPATINYSVSQHYTHPTYAPFLAQQQQQQPQPRPATTITTTAEQNTYIQYLLQSNLGSTSSQNDLEIALAHGIIDHNTYTHALTTHNQLLQQQAQQQQQQMRASQALTEECSAHSMLSASAATKQRSDPVYRTSEYFNEYYGGVNDEYLDEDEMAPCSVYSAGGGGRLRPFDL